MNNDRNKTPDNEPRTPEEKPEPKEQRSSAFNEPKVRDEKSTVNPEEEADLEQERKEAMTERD